MTTLVLALLLFAGLSVAIFVTAPTGPVSPLPRAFLEFSRKDVRSVDIATPAGAVRLERDAGDGERWSVLVGRHLVRAASDRVEGLLSDLERLAPRNLWTAREVRAGERAGWGLESPGVTLKLGLEGREIRAAFGSRTPEGMNVYAEKDGNGDVYVVPEAFLKDVQEARPESFRERRPVGLSTWDLKSFALERDDGVAVEAEKASGGTWEVLSPWKGAADPPAMEALVAAVLGVEVVDFVADGAPDLALYGLLKPRARVRLRRQAREEPVVLLLGGDAGGGKAWFAIEGEPSVYTCGGAFPGAVASFDPSSLRDHNVLRIGWTRLDSIEFAAGEASWKLLRVHDRWDLERPVRTPAEVPAVEELLEALRGLQAVRFLDGEDPAAHGLGDPGSAPARLVLQGTEPSGSRHLLIGARDAGGNCPVRILPRTGGKDEGALLVVEGALLDRLEAGPLSFRSREVWRIPLEEVRGISRTTGGVTEDFRFAGGTWTAGDGAALPRETRERLTRVLAHLLTLRCSAWVERTKPGLDGYGLGEAPAGATVTVRTEEGGRPAERTLVIGLPVEEGGARFARLGGDDLVFRLPDHVLDGADLVPLHDLLTGPWATAPVPEAPPAKEE